jgi:ADP-ribose pyrophosphatase YjhB (NUDIX family)
MSDRRMLFSLGAFAVILNDRREVLLCHRTDMDLWNLPGGGVERGEAPWEAAVREAREEAGVEVEVERLVGVYAKPDQDVVAFAFLCRLVGGHLRTTEEADRVGFFAYEAIPQNTSPRQKERIHDALTSDVPVIRTQRGPSSKELLDRGELS